MDPATITDRSFVLDPKALWPTWNLPLKTGETLQIVKRDEEVEKGYYYEVRRFWANDWKQENQIIGVGWFDGFGCDDRPNDVIHFIRAYVRAFCR